MYNRSHRLWAKGHLEIFDLYEMLYISHTMRLKPNGKYLHDNITMQNILDDSIYHIYSIVSCTWT